MNIQSVESLKSKPSGTAGLCLAVCRSFQGKEKELCLLLLFIGNPFGWGWREVVEREQRMVAELHRARGMDAQHAVACARRQVTWRQRKPRGAQQTAPKSARRAGQPSYRGIAPRRCAPAAQPPPVRGAINVREQRRRWREHDEVV